MGIWEKYPVGARVRCPAPEEFTAEIARKLRNREGVVEGHQAFSGAPIVQFPKARNRKEWQWVPSHPRHIELAQESAP